jgi:hypothetical protein
VIAALGASDLLDRPGGIFLRRTDQIAEEDKVLLQTVARADRESIPTARWPSSSTAGSRSSSRRRSSPARAAAPTPR